MISYMIKRFSIIKARSIFIPSLDTIDETKPMHYFFDIKYMKPVLPMSPKFAKSKI